MAPDPDHELRVAAHEHVRLLQQAYDEVKVRLAQHRFRGDVMRAYRRRCTVCALKRSELVQAAHIVEFAHEGGMEVSNGLALRAIHHLAYDRNLMGIDPGGVVNISRALREAVDGAMLREGLQSFHGHGRELPRSLEDHPNPSPQLLERRFERFVSAAA